MKKIHIIGLGLLGGSFALALKREKPEILFTGTDNNQQHLEEAVALGIIDEIREQPDEDTDVIVIATPIHTIAPLLKDILDNVPKNTLVMDFGSTKKSICEAVADHPRRENFLAAHPIAGTEYSGPKAAITGLLQGKVLAICEMEKTSLELKAMAYDIFEALQMNLRFMDPDDHDLQFAYISHLSHISSFMLGKTVLDKMKDDSHILDMAGSGFSTTVRLAKSSPATWTPIFLDNKTNVLEALDLYIKNLIAFREKIMEDDAEGLRDEMAEVNKIKKILDYGG
ncbi:MAG TPA: prephenate dehydrogenase [Cyclobacteriaceae bacterium]|nr:prephenate dehydrogenase [Cyclobacteriaceae bacterium]